MKRFIKVYMTMFIVAILTTNLVLVLIYGQQFLYSASEGSNDELVLNSPVLIVNGVVLAVFILFWFIANHFYRQSRDSFNSHMEGSE